MLNYPSRSVEAREAFGDGLNFAQDIVQGFPVGMEHGKLMKSPSSIGERVAVDKGRGYIGCFRLVRRGCGDVVSWLKVPACAIRPYGP